MAVCVQLALGVVDLNPVGQPGGRRLRGCFDALIEGLPGSAATVARLFDVIEVSSKARPARKRHSRTST